MIFLNLPKRLNALPRSLSNALLTTIQSFDAIEHELMTATLDKQQTNEHHHDKHQNHQHSHHVQHTTAVTCVKESSITSYERLQVVKQLHHKPHLKVNKRVLTVRC